jgi:hypothetical protein
MGEKFVIRWTPPRAGSYQASVTFSGVAGYMSTPAATTDVHDFVGTREIFSEVINLSGRGNSAQTMMTVSLQASDFLDIKVGWGDGSYAFDSTGVSATICPR